MSPPTRVTVPHFSPRLKRCRRLPRRTRPLASRIRKVRTEELILPIIPGHVWGADPF